MEGCLLETFRWDLKWDMLLETFETFQTYHRGLLTWNFQMRLEMRCAIRNFWNFSNLSWRVAYLKLSDETGNEMRCAIRNFWNVSNLSWSVAYLKLSDETWNEMCYLKLKTCQGYHGGLLIWNFQMRLEMRYAIRNFWNFSTHHRSCLLETFRWHLKWDMLFETFEMSETWNCLNMSWELFISNFQMRLEKRCDVPNI